jgi:hypothetical protein
VQSALRASPKPEGGGLIYLARAVALIAALLMVACGGAVFLLSLPIAAEMAIGMPPELHCQYFAGARRGWGCAAFGNVATHPFATAAAVLLSAICSQLISILAKERRMAIAVVLFLMLWALFIGAAVVVRAMYIAQGHANSAYVGWTLIPVAIFAGVMLVLRHLKQRPFGVVALDPTRHAALSKGIEIEIAERRANSRANQ